jgi:hypothetical protein
VQHKGSGSVFVSMDTARPFFLRFRYNIRKEIGITVFQKNTRFFPYEFPNGEFIKAGVECDNRPFVDLAAPKNAFKECRYAFLH